MKYVTCKSSLKKIYTRLGLDKTKINDYVIAYNNLEIKKNMLHYYSGRQLSKEEEIAINFLKTNPLTVFPYEFVRKYNISDISVFKDLSNNLYYVNHNSKKLFFPKGMSKFEIKKYYSEMLREQDLNSPHRYLVNGFLVNEGDIVLDVGSAEGIFVLDVIELATHVYIFEPDEKWIAPLKATCDPWKDKITIVNQYVSDSDTDTSLRLDTYCKDFISHINFIKMDVEGTESRVISGAKKILALNEKIILTICTYHNQSDYEEFRDIFQKLHFSIEHSDGFMIFYNDRMFAEPYLRRGLLRAKRNEI